MDRTSRNNRSNSSEKTSKANSAKYKNVMTIGALWESDYGDAVAGDKKLSISFDDFNGEIEIYIKRGDKAGKLYKVKRLYVNKPYNEHPKKVADLKIDLDNPNTAEEIQE